MLKSIQSRDNALVKYAVRLAASAAFRAGEGMFFAEGARLCLDLAQHQKPQTLFATRRALDACPELENVGLQGCEISEPVAEKLAGTQTPQGVFGLFALPVVSARTLCCTGGLLLCEALQNPANLGSMLRSAAGLGLCGAALSPGCADPFGPKAVRAGMGAVYRLPVVQCGLQDAAAMLKKQGGTLYAAALHGAAPLAKAAVKRPFGLLVGNEGAGLSAAALALADVRVCIPMHAGMQSLNAAAAAAVLMYHFTNEVDRLGDGE